MINQVDLSKTQNRNNWYVDFIAVPISMAVLLLAGHYGLFFGETFLTSDDPISIYNYLVDNSRTGGWRPDVGLGQSFFAGDPGMSHVWAISRFFIEIFSDKNIGFQTLIMIVVWMSCFVLYLFLKKITPEISRTVSFFLSTTIAFGSLRYEYCNFFIEVITTCLMSLVLSDFFKQPKIKHYFYYTSIIFASAFLGSTSAFYKILIFASVFSIGIAVYNRWYFFGKDLRKALKRFFILNFASGLSFLTLGAWVFYSIFIEMKTMGYVRDPDYSLNYFFNWPGIQRAATHFFPYFHAGLLPTSAGTLGIEKHIGTQSWNNFSPLFPVIFLLIVAQKNNTFWEFISKFVIIFLFLLQEMIYWIPGILMPLAKTMIYYPPIKGHTSIQVFEILLTGILIVRLRNYSQYFQDWPVKTAKIVAGLLVFLYCGVFIFLFLSSIAPEFLSRVLNLWLENIFSISQGKFFSTVVVENINLFHDVTDWKLLTFYGTTALLLSALASRNWHRLFLIRGGVVFSIALLINNLFLSWSVYQLEKTPLIWEKLKMDGRPVVEKFKPTDRLIRVFLAPCSQKQNGQNYAECIKNKFFNEEFGSYRQVTGFTLTPALEFSKLKSVTSQPVADFITTLMGLEGTVKSGLFRSFPVDNYIYTSRVYDISATNYMVSAFSIPPTKGLELIFKSKQFYLYRNLNAWPYFYLADSIKTIHSYEDLYNAKRGEAYLWGSDEKINIPPKSLATNRSIKLFKFEYGGLKFIYQSNEPELLVIADSWHPNWRATVNGLKAKIFKANGVFKGILLPPGEGEVSLSFDNSPYRFGILISVIAWVIFLSCWAGVAKKFPRIY